MRRQGQDAQNRILALKSVHFNPNGTGVFLGQS